MFITDIEYLTEENLATLAENISRKFTSLRIFTGDSIVIHAGDGHIYYRIEATHPEFDEPFIIEEHDSMLEICTCNECLSNEEDFWEYRSIFFGLVSAYARYPNLSKSLFVDSEAFRVDARDGFYQAERTSCEIQNAFMKEFFEFLWKVGLGGDGENVQIYKNR